MAFDAAYEALTDHDDDSRWAYGTGFADPLAGVSTAVPSDVESADLVAYCLMLGDDALVMSHRLQEWVTRAPELEDELALANIALDLLGQARLLLGRAGEVEGAGRDEDAFAFLREPAEFRNVGLVERADDDFAQLVARLLVFATWRLALLDRLSTSRDPVLAAIGGKGVKEVSYHREYAAQWVVRLGDGTEVSHARMQAAVDMVWPSVGELFRAHEIELRLAAAGVAVDPAGLRDEFDAIWQQVLTAATLRPADVAAGLTSAGLVPGGLMQGELTQGELTPGGLTPGGLAPGGLAPGGLTQGELTPGGRASAGLTSGELIPGGLPSGELAPAGRSGDHTPALATILAELQGLARSVPGGVW